MPDEQKVVSVPVVSASSQHVRNALLTYGMHTVTARQHIYFFPTF